MVTLEPIAAKRDAAYYTGSYYLDGGGQSVWLGQGAEVLALAGQRVQPEQFQNLWAGRYPDGSRDIVQIQRHKGKDAHTPGTDVVINADKTVSIAFATGTEEQRQAIAQALLATAREVVAYFEENCAFSRRGQGGHSLEKAGITAGAFLEYSNRAGEPHLHVHVVILNAAFRSSNRSFGTIRRRPFFQHKMAAGALARADLSARLSALGLTCRRPVNEKGQKSWNFVVQGVPDAARRAMSSRAEAIKAWLQEEGKAGSKAAAEAAVKTRGNKVFKPLGELLSRWKQDLEKLGFTAAHATALWGRGKELSAERDRERAERAVTRAMTAVTARTATFTAKDVIREAGLIAQDGGVSAASVRKAVSEHLRQSRDLVWLAAATGEQRFTTKTLFETEKKLIRLVEEARTEWGAWASDRAIERAIGRMEKRCTAEKRKADPRAPEVRLSEEQRAAVKYMCQGIDTARGTQAIRMVTGYAGVGKTTAVACAVDALQRGAHRRVIGCSLSGVATENLDEAGLKERVTVAKLLHDLEKKSTLAKLKHHGKQLVRAARKKPTYTPQRIKLRRGDVVILDESATLGVPTMTRLVEAVMKRGATLICLGDPGQLQHPVEHGCPHRMMQERLGAACISTITRQKDRADRDNVLGLSEGKAREVLKDLRARGRLHVGETKEAAFREIIRKWQTRGLGQPDAHVILAQTNVERDALNRRAQAARLDRGYLREASILLGPTQKRFHENDAVIFTTPANTPGGRIDRRTMPGLLQYGIRNGTTATLVRIHRARNELTFKLKERCVTIPVDRCAPALDLAYCLTAHRSQSKTYESAFIALGGSMTHRELAYVVASRARGETHIFCDKSSVLSLSGQLSRSRAKEMAHDYLPQQDRRHVQLQTLTV
jgi:conjugative relaxase-like TrwC/TraI family protein